MKSITCQEIMTINVQVTSPESSAFAAATIMNDSNVGFLPVVQSLKAMDVVGVVTDRDLAIRVIAAELSPYSTRLQTIMSHGAVSCNSFNTAEEAYDLMKKHGVRRLPVVDSANRLLGVVSMQDILNRGIGAQLTENVVHAITTATPISENDDQ